MKLVMDKKTLIKLEDYRVAHNLPKIENYGMSVEHNSKSWQLSLLLKLKTKLDIEKWQKFQMN